QVDHDFGPLDAILQPIEGVQAAGHHPSIFTVLAEQPHRVVDRRRLKEFERRHHIAYHGHICVLLRSLRWSLLHRAYGARLKCALSAALASGGPLRAPRESRPRSPAPAGRSRPRARLTGRSILRRSRHPRAARRCRGRRWAFPDPEYRPPPIAFFAGYRGWSAA